MSEIQTVEQKEKRVLDFWQTNFIFEKSLEKTKDSKPYIFYDGPPFATGTPHYGHLLASVLKDVFPRYFTMQNRYVKRVWGWDCHGLPIENIAEKELGINSKDEIEKLGVKKFNNFCRSKVLTYANDWKYFVDRIGRWVEFDNSYKTMDNNYIESVWWAFKQLYDKGYIYEGEKILMYCPRCSTPLAKSEIAMDNSYKIVKDLTVVLKFKLKEKINDNDVYALAWTTTPWTLPSNLALTVNPDLIYSYIKDKTDNTIYLLGKDLISKFFKSEEEYETIKEIKGKELEGKEFEPLFPYFANTENAFKFLLADFVTAEDGTGIVHTAPAFGEDDNVVCRKYKIPMVQPVDEKGNFTNDVKDFAGKYIHDANEEIINFLKSQNKVISVRKLEHEYPFCYRCETKLMYRALPAWFVDIQKIKNRLQELNLEINWIPEYLKEGRMQNNISTAPDWNISRNRYWASAIPIWKSESNKIKVIGSIEELKKYAINLPAEEIDLHKDYLDEIILKVNNEEYKRIPEVMDCWFESGSMTFAQFHYPFENKEFFDKNFPAQFVVEYIGQTRAWFYYMIVLSAILFDKIPFENVLTTGTILAEDGQKMSKSKKNYPDPNIVVNKYGADALRFYLLSSALMSGDNFNFAEKGVEEIYKKVSLLYYNVNNFYALYKDNSKIELPNSKNILDSWIIAKTHNLIKECEINYEKYDTINLAKEIRSFIDDDLSTWYVRRCRDRFNDGDKDAQKTLAYVLSESSKVIAPLMPFVSEYVYQTVYSEKESVHLQDFPKYDEKLINKELIENMKIVRNIVSLALKERELVKISLKQPLQELIVTGITLEQEYLDIIADELNVKKIVLGNKEEKEIFVKLNTEITPELEAEGSARELSRGIQAYRKQLGLQQKDLIDLELVLDSELQVKLTPQKEFIAKRINAKSLIMVSEAKDYKNKTNFKLKDKEIIIAIL